MATVVQDIYSRLFEKHGPPLVMKSDNGGPFKAEDTKALLANYQVLPLYSPKRHPQYNGAVERANGQVTSYQQALAEYHQRPAGPTCDDAEGARLLANDLAHPQGWRGPTARTLWEQHAPVLPDERAAFLASVAGQRLAARAAWNFAEDASLTHYEAAAVDRRAIRDALVAHDLLRIHPWRKTKRGTVAAWTPPVHAGNDTKSMATPAPTTLGAGTITETDRVVAAPAVGATMDRQQRLLALVHYLFRGGPFLRQ